MYIPFGEKILVLKFELGRISILPSKITLNFYLRGLLYKGGPKNKKVKLPVKKDP